jgi:2-deoxy-D-gluconate 3-dehydrogenase
LAEPGKLAAKVVIVTGAGSSGPGIGTGKGISVLFAREGAKVVLVDKIADRADETLQMIQADGGEAVVVTADLADMNAGAQVVDAAVSHFGGVDILVNNAGIYPMSPMLGLSREAWQKVIDVNLTGLAFASKAVGLRMVEQGRGGKIVNIASIDALHPSMVGLAAYDSSKGGVLMFTRAFALEMAQHGVTVNAIAPGGINTEGTAAPLQDSGMTPEEMAAMTEQFAAQIPLGRMGEADDIAKVAVFLASSGSDYITGELIVVDGGRLLK